MKYFGLILPSGNQAQFGQIESYFRAKKIPAQRLILKGESRAWRFPDYHRYKLPKDKEFPESISSYVPIRKAGGHAVYRVQIGWPFMQNKKWEDL